MPLTLTAAAETNGTLINGEDVIVDTGAAGDTLIIPGDAIGDVVAIAATGEGT